jgi:hypothetical protein
MFSYDNNIYHLLCLKDGRKSYQLYIYLATMPAADSLSFSRVTSRGSDTISLGDYQQLAAAAAAAAAYIRVAPCGTLIELLMAFIGSSTDWFASERENYLAEKSRQR